MSDLQNYVNAPVLWAPRAVLTPFGHAGTRCHHLLFFELLSETLADFDNFRHATSRGNLTKMDVVKPASR